MVAKRQSWAVQNDRCLCSRGRDRA